MHANPRKHAKTVGIAPGCKVGLFLLTFIILFVGRERKIL